MNSIQAGVNHERARGPVQAGVQHVAAIHFEGVVLDPPSIHAVLHTAHHSYLGFVLPCLIAHARRKGDELREITAVESNRHDLFFRNRAGNRGALGLHLFQAAGFHVHFFSFCARWLQGSVQS